MPRPPRTAERTGGRSGTLAVMLYLVIERFKPNATRRIGERVRTSGRLLPPGVVYQGSWVDPASERCFQIMESPSRELLDAWIERWSDLVDFEVIPVVTSSEFWSNAEK